MVKELATLCDICKETKATAKCFLCDKDICKDHNFGGGHSNVIIHAWVYNDHVFEIKEEDTFLDCCPDCTDVLKKILDQKGDILRNRIQENLAEIKDWLLKEIKNEKGV